MKKRIVENTLESRLLDRNSLCAYLNLGANTAVSFAKRSGAEIRFGRRTLYDRRKSTWRLMSLLRIRLAVILRNKFLQKVVCYGGESTARRWIYTNFKFAL